MGMMLYHSPKETPGRVTFTEAQRGNPQALLVPKGARAHTGKSGFNATVLRQIRCWQVAAGNMKTRLYLVFQNLCPDTARDRHSDSKKRTVHAEMENES